MKKAIFLVLLAYTLPMFGVFIEHELYRYIIVLGVHILGLIIFFKWLKKYSL